MKISQLLIILFLFSGFCSAGQQLQPGAYRWRIVRNDQKAIVFTTYVFDAGKKMYLINGKDSLLVDQISPEGDSIHIELPYYESSFMLKQASRKTLRGYWIKKSGGVEILRMPVEVEQGISQRFFASRRAGKNISGEWATTFSGEGNKTVAGGDFVQRGNHLTGTFRTSYGDYRFLEGIVSGDSVFLSGFDGSMALLFEGKISAHGIEGKMYSRNATPLVWKSHKGKAVIDTDLSRVKPGAGKVQFSYPDVFGKQVSLSDPEFKDKVVVIQLMGSWCPNCFDEMGFVLENYNRYHAMGVAFVAIAYERTEDFAASVKALEPFLKKFHPPYHVLIPPVSVADEQKAEKTFPQINGIFAFPTTIFLDKNGNIAKIHTGFDGPATGIHFEKFKKDFEQTLKYLTEK